VEKPDPAAFSAALRAQRYYTAPLALYTRAMEAHYRAMRSVQVDLELGNPEEPEAPPSAAEEAGGLMSTANQAIGDSEEDLMCVERLSCDVLDGEEAEA
jgi:hypothetical protein